MSLSLITDATSFNEIPVPLQNGLVSRGIHIKFAFESTLHSHNTVCFGNSSMHQLCCCEVSAILHFTALWRRAGKLKISLVNPLNAELNPICHLLALLGAHHILHVSG